jgi:hypothetical protein
VHTTEYLPNQQTPGTSTIIFANEPSGTQHLAKSRQTCIGRSSPWRERDPRTTTFIHTARAASRPPAGNLRSPRQILPTARRARPTGGGRRQRRVNPHRNWPNTQRRSNTGGGLGDT